jgi:hypothetical protein
MQTPFLRSCLHAVERGALTIIAPEHEKALLTRAELDAKLDRLMRWDHTQMEGR